ncbi:MAG: hypothetical protein ABW107_08660, partial [Candidatus Thiodiazotropha sp. 6PLUC5]
MEQPRSNRVIRRVALVLSLVTFVLIIPFPASSAEHDEAEAAIRVRDFKSAADIYKQLAEQGDAEAQFALGGLYRGGRGVKKDYAQALQW